jgi:hypothetical protein
MLNDVVNYGKQLLNNTNNTIKSGFISNYSEFNIEQIKNQNIINFDLYDYVICKKINETNFYMNWHIDDYAFIRHSKNKIVNNKISDRISIYHKQIPPQYSLIIYESKYGVDFTGGELEFVDGTKIKPDYGLYVLFNSIHMHRVNKINSGTRICYLIKFYKKIEKIN